MLINVYVCPKHYYESQLKDVLTGSVVVYPEIEVAYYDWYDFFTQNEFSNVITQSSEFLRFVRTIDDEVHVMVLDEDTQTLIEMEKDKAALKVLNCYELLMVKSYLFERDE